MKSSQQKKVHIRVKFSDRGLAKAAFEDLGRSRALSVNILRGRITQKEAHFELAVTGPAQRINEFIRVSNHWEASVGISSMGVA
jgi:hypothetical protein